VRFSFSRSKAKQVTPNFHGSRNISFFLVSESRQLHIDSRRILECRILWPVDTMLGSLLLVVAPAAMNDGE
jgi:hypothetical protein